MTLGQAVEAAGSAADAVPGGQEARQGGRLHRLDLAAQPRQRAATDEAQHLGITPLALHAAGPELAAQQHAVRHQPLQRRLDHTPRQLPAVGRVLGVEGTVAASPARQQRAEGVGRGGPGTARARPTGGDAPTASR